MVSATGLACATAIGAAPRTISPIAPAAATENRPVVKEWTVDELAPAIKACRFLIREAARLDLPAGALAEDLERLCPDEALVKELKLPATSSRPVASVVQTVSQ